MDPLEMERNIYFYYSVEGSHGRGYKTYLVKSMEKALKVIDYIKEIPIDVFFETKLSKIYDDFPFKNNISKKRFSVIVCNACSIDSHTINAVNYFKEKGSISFSVRSRPL